MLHRPIGYKVASTLLHPIRNHWISLLLALVTVLSAVTYIEIAQKTLAYNGYALAVIYGDILLGLILFYLVGRRFLALWVAHRKKLPGARLQGRFVSIFSLLTVVPSLSVALFAATFLHGALESWFNERHQQSLQESLRVAETYFEEHKKKILADASTMAQLVETHIPEVLDREEALCAILTKISSLKSFSEAILLDSSLEVMARTPLSYALEFENVRRQALEEALHQSAVLLNASSGHIRALVGLDFGGERAFLLVGRDVDAQVMTHLTRVRKMVSDYMRTFSERWKLEVTFAFTFLLVALLFVFSSMIVALAVSSDIVRPISQLISATRSMKARNLAIRIPLKEGHQRDELHLLQRTFNEMAEELQEQQRALAHTNALLEERHQFVENVLSSISCGTIRVDAQGIILFLNKTAISLLKVEKSPCIGRDFGGFFPEFAATMEEAARDPLKNLHEAEIPLKLSGEWRTLLLRFTPTSRENQFDGWVVTFDDLTDLIAAQKKAAWGDVARRLAHEIKNPLTPIQLAAERLHRKYSAQIATELDTFERLTETITQQVDTIRKLLDEFSLFARLPEPSLRTCDLQKLCEQAVFLARTTYPTIQVTLTCKKEESAATIEGDERLLQQAFLNLLKNSAHALLEGPTPLGRPPAIEICLSKGKKNVKITFLDNGPGFPEARLEDLTDSYVTFSQGGTGLGLAIAKKIVQDHKGSMVLKNRRKGAEVCLTFLLEKDRGQQA